MELINFRLDKETKVSLETYCRREERSISHAIRYAIKRLLKDEMESTQKKIRVIPTKKKDKLIQIVSDKEKENVQQMVRIV